MTIDADTLLNWKIPEAEQHYTKRDTMLYALGLGLGADPLDSQQLRFVYEDGLEVLPTMPVVLGRPGNWARNPDTGVNYLKVVHGEQSFRLHRPLAPEGTIIGKTRVAGVVDKGRDKGALIFTETLVVDKASGETLCTLKSTTFARGDGGFGGPSGPTPEPHPVPESRPDAACDLPTLPQAALIYRLSGDYNPLHADPKTAKAAGFPRPILHGLCTFGVVGHALLKTVCGYQPRRLTAMQARFSSPVFPGETIRTEMWQDGTRVSFRALVPQRNVVVLNNGLAELAP